MDNGHNGTVFRVLYPKISTGQEKLAPTGRHGRHVSATLDTMRHIEEEMAMGVIDLQFSSEQVLGLNCKKYFSNLRNIFEKMSNVFVQKTSGSSRWRKGVIDVILFSGGFEQPVGDTQQRAVL